MMSSQIEKENQKYFFFNILKHFAREWRQRNIALQFAPFSPSRYFSKREVLV
jgi:hypothetical protein